MQTEDSPVTDHRTRLLQGLAQSVATKGYADTTIADIVREAGCRAALSTSSSTTSPRP
jgi:AcrR family transcriptional regulator